MPNLPRTSGEKELFNGAREIGEGIIAVLVFFLSFDLSHI